MYKAWIHRISTWINITAGNPLACSILLSVICCYWHFLNGDQIWFCELFDLNVSQSPGRGITILDPILLSVFSKFWHSRIKTTFTSLLTSLSLVCSPFPQSFSFLSILWKINGVYVPHTIVFPEQDPGRCLCTFPDLWWHHWQLKVQRHSSGEVW